MLHSTNNLFLKPVMAQINTILLLPLCQPPENAILLEVAYRKRMRPVPRFVEEAAGKRFIELMNAPKYLVKSRELLLASYQTLADLLWDGLTKDEQDQWLLKVK